MRLTNEELAAEKAAFMERRRLAAEEALARMKARPTLRPRWWDATRLGGRKQGPKPGAE